jgi:hypothetical protein
MNSLARQAFADQLASLHVEVVVVRHRLSPPLFYRQAGLGAVERLDLNVSRG